MVDRPKSTSNRSTIPSRAPVKAEVKKSDDLKQNTSKTNATKVPEVKKNTTLTPAKAIDAKKKLDSRTRHTNCVDRREHTLELAEYVKSIGTYPHPKGMYEKIISSHAEYVVRALIEKADDEYE